MDERPRRDGWERPQERSEPGQPPPRSLQVAAVLLIGLGAILAFVGVIWLGVTATLQVDPDYRGQLDLDALGALAAIGFAGTFVGIAQVVAGIGVLRLRRSSRLFGIVSALGGAVALGLGAVFAATGAFDRVLRDGELSPPDVVVICLAGAAAYLISAIALTQDWPNSSRI
jgi:hypothetical protein